MTTLAICSQAPGHHAATRLVEACGAAILDSDRRTRYIGTWALILAAVCNEREGLPCEG